MTNKNLTIQLTQTLRIRSGLVSADFHVSAAFGGANAGVEQALTVGCSRIGQKTNEKKEHQRMVG